MISRLVVVNRGEPASRLVRAVRQLNQEGREDLTVIALHTEAQQRALFVRAADEAVVTGSCDPSGQRLHRISTDRFRRTDFAGPSAAAHAVSALAQAVPDPPRRTATRQRRTT